MNAWNRTQLHHPRHIRPLLPPPRILHPQRRAPLLPHSRPSPSPRNRQPRASLHTGIRSPRLRARRDTPALTPAHLDAHEHPAALDTQASPPQARQRSHRLGRRVQHLPSITHHGTRGADQETGHRGSAPALVLGALVPDAASADGEWED